MHLYHKKMNFERWVLNETGDPSTTGNNGAETGGAFQRQQQQEREDDSDEEALEIEQRHRLARERQTLISESLADRLSSHRKDKEEDVCHVCKQKGHFSGFIGSKYVDCINKPCYICSNTGHSTGACPFKLAPQLYCTKSEDASFDGRGGVLKALYDRESGQKHLRKTMPPQPGPYTIDAAVVKIHARRTTCLAFHPEKPSIVLSGDKHGQVASWNIDKCFERTVYTDINKWLTNNIVYTGSDRFATSSYEGTVKIFDAEVGMVLSTLVSANRNGWQNVEEEDKAGRWITMIGLDCSASSGVVYAGSSKGRLYVLDQRMQEPAHQLQAHAHQKKLQCVSVHPTDEYLLLTAGNDYHARVHDVRKFGENTSQHELVSFEHPRVINAAYFSPLTGNKIVTTCQDNRIRVWDQWSLAALSNDGAPSREIVHSHTFNRHLTPFKAELCPHDPTERLMVIGRYISEDYNGTKLHPIDVFDISTGRLLTEMVDPNLTTISPVNKYHPTRDIIVTGSSRSLYVWKEDESLHEDDIECIRNEEDGPSTSAPSGRPCPSGSRHFILYDADTDNAGKKKTSAASKRKNP